MQRTVACLMLMALASAAPAQDLAGFYVGGGIGNATLELEDSESSADFKSDDTGYKLFAGYRIIDWVAVEASYAQYGSPEDRVFGLNLEGDFHSFSVNALGLLPLGSFDLFGRAGIARWEGRLRSTDSGDSAREDNFDPIIGIGAQLRAGRVAVRLEAEALLLSFDDDEDDESDGDDWVDMYSLGILVRF